MMIAPRATSTAPTLIFPPSFLRATAKRSNDRSPRNEALMQQVRVLVFVLASLSVGKTLEAQAGTVAGHVLPTAGIVTLSFNSAVLGTAEAQRDLDSLQK